MTTAPESDNSVNDFLKTISLLGEKRNKEDDERTRKLEAEILQGRRERQARRAERAKSIASSPRESPVNFYPPHEEYNFTDTNTNTDTTTARPTTRSSTSSTVGEMEQPESLNGSQHAANRHASNRERQSPLGSPSITSTLPSRSGTLSWQRRPNSRDSNVSQHRPTSKAFSDAPALAPPTHSQERSPEEPTRSQIAQNLSAKDPSWFRQTADRGVGSAAFRKNNDSNDGLATNNSMRLPGLSREALLGTDSSTTSAAVNDRSPSPVRNESVRPTGSWNNRYYRISSPPIGGTEHPSPLPSANSQILEPAQNDSGATTDDRSQSRTTMSSAQGRLSPERPSSPTKGIGGFVQSAMLKRSDSVNKRWKLDAPPGLTRADSIASNRSAASVAKSARSSQRESRLLDPNQRSSPISSSRPGSSHDQETAVHKLQGDADVKSENAHSVREFADEPLPTSPSKTMDPKRWSPTKASWLESKLNRPDSPSKSTSSPVPPQPTWKANNPKAERGTKVEGKELDSEVNRNSPITSPSLGTRLPKSSVTSPRDQETQSASLLDVSEGQHKALPELEAPPGPIRRSGEKDTPSEVSEPPIRKALPQSVSEIPNRKQDTWDSPVITGSKPATPPKPNFRTNLKTREQSDIQNSKAEPEFKNVFGKLRRTETKNYVAPDELKNNILRGKAGLSVTGGPKKTQRVDEFKESILKQKEAMKTGGGSTIKRAPEADSVVAARKPSPVIPEALSKRQQMNRSSSAQSDQTARSDSTSASELVNKQSFETEQTPMAESKTYVRMDKSSSSATERSRYSQKASEAVLDTPKTLVKPPTVSKPDSRTATLKSPLLVEPRSILPSSGTPASKTKESAKAGSLAERLNPALAGLISRKPGQPAKSTDQSNQVEGSSVSGAHQVKDIDNASQSPFLTHATKGRARGPKRRLPNTSNRPSSAAEEKDTEGVTIDSKKALESPLIKSENAPASVNDKLDGANRINEANGAIEKEQFQKEDMSITKKGLSSHDSAKTMKAKPAVAPKSPELRKVSSPKERQDPKLESVDGTSETDPAGSERPVLSSKAAKALWDPPPSTMQPKSVQSPIRQRPVSPIKESPSTTMLPSKRDLSPEKSESFPRSKRSFRDSKLSPSEATSINPSTEEVPPNETTPASEPSGKNPILELLIDLFIQRPSTKTSGVFETQKLLSSNAAHSKSSDREQISKVSQLDSSGKATPMPPFKEHILYEDGIYICVFTYYSKLISEKQTDVFLWIGDQVPEAAAEDAQLFGRKTAREHSTRLQVLRQGKEPLLFLQALAGVLLIRRPRSSDQYMLSVRSHMKHLALDQVDFSIRSLCSGFPYVINCPSGKQYLWKGKGSNADELGIARLIGMDLGLTGVPMEIDEGAEPDEFFSCFPQPHQRRQAAEPWTAHWALKAKLPRYSTRLFRVSVVPDRSASTSTISSLWGRRNSSPPKNKTFTADIVEITPFAQRDLEPGQIYVLDAFFEVFVLGPPQTSSRHIEFTTALLFAQEYAILATSMQDRPTMPAGTVVFPSPSPSASKDAKYTRDPANEIATELPTGFTETFRKWDPRAGIAGEVKRWEAMRLEEVLEACEGEGDRGAA